MTKTPWIVGAALASALALTSLAHAMPGGDEGRMGPPKTRAELQAMIAGHFKAADADKDGIVTKAEADAAAKRTADAEFADAQLKRQKAEEELAKLKADMETRRQADAGQR